MTLFPLHHAPNTHFPLHFSNPVLAQKRKNARFLFPKKTQFTQQMRNCTLLALDQLPRGS